MVEAIRMTDCPGTLVSDSEGIVGVAERGLTPWMCKPLWDELYALTAGKDIEFVWCKRDQPLGSRLAHHSPGTRRD